MEKILSSRGFDHKIEQKYQPCRIGSLCDLGYFFLHEYLSMTPLLVFKYWHCLQPRSWELRKYFPKFQTLFIDFLLFKLPPWISFFLFSLYFTHFLPELVYLWCFLYLLKYNPHLNKALLFVNALIIRFTERFILYKKWGIFTAIPSYPYVKQLIASQSIDYEFLNEIVCES